MIFAGDRDYPKTLAEIPDAPPHSLRKKTVFQSPTPSNARTAITRWLLKERGARRFSKPESNFLCNIGYGVRPYPHPRLPRFDFDEACKIL